MRMNIILATLGSGGDVYPFIAIGRALAARGHQTTLVTSSYFETAARQAGLDFSPIHTRDEYDRITRDPDLWHPRRGVQVLSREIVVPGLVPVHRTIERLHVPGQTVVVANCLAFGARVAHETSAIPLVTVLTTPFCLRSLLRPPDMALPAPVRWLGRLGTRITYRVADYVIDRIVGKVTNAFRQTFGLPAVRRFMQDWWLSPQRVIGIWPTWYAPPQRDWPEHVRLTGFIYHDTALADAGFAEADRFISEGTPPVVFTPGTAMRFAHAFFVAAVEACRLIGRRGMLITPHSEQIPKRLPAEVIHLPYLPFGSYLHRACAVVHHGGVGTVARSLLTGLPQLVCPMGCDQFDNGVRVEQLGIGFSIPGAKVQPRRMADMLDGLLSSERVAVRCQKLAGRIDPEEAIRQTCDMIEKSVMLSRQGQAAHLPAEDAHTDTSEPTVTI